MENKIYLNDLVSLEKFGKNIKLVRHYDSRIKLNNDMGTFKEFVKFDLLEEYQSYQSKDVFNCDYIASFYGEENSKAIFYGIYKVIHKGKNAPKPSEKFMKYWNEMNINEETYFYELEELPEYRKFKDRIVIKWGEGSSTRSWHQWFSSDKRKEVIEIRPENFIGEYPGWKNVILDHFDLKRMISNPDSHRNWYDELSKVSAVYAIVDKSNGNVYIGSAYGEAEGLWGRWATYANRPTGGNQLLIELEKINDRFYEQFQYCILEILPRGIRKEDIIGLEQLTKRKLGQKVCILNAN
jgi:hypothetical protein